MSQRRFRATVDETTFEIDVDGDSVIVRDAPAAAEAKAPVAPGATFAITPTRDDTVRIRAAADTTDDASEGSLAADVAIVGDVAWVCIDGDVFTVDIEPAERARRARGSAGPEGLSAPMPATVVRILVEPGREVKRGETLLLLEAMKMELPVRAPRDGRVKALHCKAGELVQPGIALVDLE